jgi:hypothetical protein
MFHQAGIFIWHCLVITLNDIDEFHLAMFTHISVFAICGILVAI